MADDDSTYPCNTMADRWDGYWRMVSTRNADRHLAFQAWRTLDPDHALESYMTRPDRRVHSTLRDSKLGPVTINGRPAGPDLQRWCADWWASAPAPSHMHIPRAVQAYRSRMTAMHTAYRQKRGHRW